MSRSIAVIENCQSKIVSGRSIPPSSIKNIIVSLTNTWDIHLDHFSLLYKRFDFYLNSPKDPQILVSLRISGVKAFIVNDAVAPPSNTIFTIYIEITFINIFYNCKKALHIITSDLNIPNY